jgi:NTP pyrophosphatase (non-canonical NTP hydrolase)
MQPRTPDLESATDIATAMQGIANFVEAQGWMQPGSPKPQTPRNLATSISIEAAELLECFQWSEDADPSRVEDELADVLIYALRFAQIAEIDPLSAVRRKLEKNRHRTWEQFPKEQHP